MQAFEIDVTDMLYAILGENGDKVLIIWLGSCLTGVYSKGCTRITLHNRICTGTKKIGFAESLFGLRLGEYAHFHCSSVLTCRVGGARSSGPEYQCMIIGLVLTEEMSYLLL